jgi:hypothetical protein
MDNKLLHQLKTNNEDYEFYPTTDEILDIIFKDLEQKRGSILDIGCGEAKLFSYFNEKVRQQNLQIEENQKSDLKQKPFIANPFCLQEYYGIEKSKILIERLDKDVVILGTDFKDTTLIDKGVDYIFCNPPYTEYVDWTCKILTEGSCKYAYLVIPERWQNNDLINFAIKKRSLEVKNLGSFDFLEADRKARAKVNLLKISFVNKEEEIITDPFKIWFEETFKISSNIESKNKWEIEKENRENRERKIKDEIVKGKNPIETLVEFYNKEMSDLMAQYQKICNLDFELLKEFNIEIPNVIYGLETKIAGLKNLYWKELFDKLNSITSRLCRRQKDLLLSKLKANVNIEFTQDNIYAIVIWACKNANGYFNRQILDLFEDLSGDVKAIRLYKSNQKVFNKDDYRYLKRKFTHYTLDYRVILRMFTNVKYSIDLLNDIRVVANNLGFETYDFFGRPEKYTQQITLIKESKERNVPLVEYKHFQNGNLHLRFNMNFIKAFNIEVARLNKWIHKKEDIKAEFDCDITDADLEIYYNSNIELSYNNVKFLQIS